MPRQPSAPRAQRVQEPTPQISSRPVEERLAELERLLGHVLARARQHPAGRKVLAYLGLDP